jgi:hypothetical protein
LDLGGLDAPCALQQYDSNPAKLESTPGMQSPMKRLRRAFGVIAGQRLQHPQEEAMMRRITIAALTGAAVLFAGTAFAQQNIDFSKVEIKATDLGNKTYMLE